MCQHDGNAKTTELSVRDKEPTSLQKTQKRTADTYLIQCRAFFWELRVRYSVFRNQFTGDGANSVYSSSEVTSYFRTK
jgi:hypothetical protein